MKFRTGETIRGEDWEMHYIEFQQLSTEIYESNLYNLTVLANHL